jgi:hypothetical protein
MDTPRWAAVLEAGDEFGRRTVTEPPRKDETGSAAQRGLTPRRPRSSSLGAAQWEAL